MLFRSSGWRMCSVKMTSLSHALTERINRQDRLGLGMASPGAADSAVAGRAVQAPFSSPIKIQGRSQQTYPMTPVWKHQPPSAVLVRIVARLCQTRSTRPLCPDATFPSMNACAHKLWLKWKCFGGVARGGFGLCCCGIVASLRCRIERCAKG